MLGGGAGLTAIGIVVTATTALGDLIEGDDGSSGGPILMFTGLVSMAGSIPFFIAAGKNRRKATANVSLKIERATIINTWVASVNHYPALSIRVRL